MPLQFLAPAQSALVNQKFVYKTIDDIKQGKLSLYKVSVNEVGFVDDIQNYLNEIADTTGQILEGDPNRKNYASNNFIANGDNRKVALEKIDLAVQFNLDEIINLNTSFGNYLADGSFKIRGYISDNAYETANGAPSGGEIYYNQTTGFIRFYNAIEVSWGDVGKQVLGIQEVPTGIVDGVNASFDVANMPLNAEAINVFLNGLIQPKTSYSFLAPTITFNVAPSLGKEIYVSYLSDGNPATPVISAGTNNVIYRTITLAEETAKEILLASAPATPTHTLVDVIGGSSVVYGSDFVIVGSTLSWDLLGLDGLLLEGDILRIQFFN